MTLRLACMILLLAIAPSAGATIPSGIQVTYDLSQGLNGTFSWNGGSQTATISAGTVIGRFANGDPSTKGTIQPGPGELSHGWLQFDQPISTNLGTGPFAFSGIWFGGPILGTVLPVTQRTTGLFSGQPGPVNGSFLTSGPGRPITFQLSRAFHDNLFVSSAPRYFSFGGALSVPWSFFTAGVEVSRSTIPEPSTGWLLLSAAAGVGLAAARGAARA